MLTATMSSDILLLLFFAIKFIGICVTASSYNGQLQYMLQSQCLRPVESKVCKESQLSLNLQGLCQSR